MEILNPELVNHAVYLHHASNLANNYDMVCFLQGEKLYSSNLYVLSDKYEIKYHFTTDCYIHCCGISDSGRYVIFQTAHAPDTSHLDGNKHFLIDVEQQELLWGLPTESNFQTIRNYFIDEKKELIFENHSDYEIIYDFQGNFLNRREWLFERATHSDASYNELLSLAQSIMQESTENGTEIFLKELVVKLITAAQNKKNVSEYQMGIAYKTLGDFYFEMRDGQNALKAYKKGVWFYPKLPVKKIIKKLEDSIGLN